MAKTNLSVLLEIRDLLEALLPEKKKKPRRPQANGKVETRPPPGPVWNLSPYPIEQFEVGTDKTYPYAEKVKILARVSHVNQRMKHLGLPNHFRHSTVMRRARLHIRIWRDK